MPYCPKCGSEVSEDMRFCPKCGAAVKAGVVSREIYVRAREKDEKYEKHEKHEKEEKGEKHEKGETGRFWILIGGLILVTLGAVSILTAAFNLPDVWTGASFLVIVGVAIILVAIYGATRASRRSPRP